MYRVLVPLDGSEFAEHAVALAASIVRRAAGTLTLLRIHMLYAYQEPSAAWGPYDPVADMMVQRQEEAYLETIVSRLTAIAPIQATSVVKYGSVPTAIVAHAQAEHNDLIVMTTHGRGPLSRFWLGSVADVVLRQTPTPILLLHAQEEPVDATAEPLFQHILIALDGSNLAEQVLAPALILGRFNGARYTLLQAVEGPAAGGPTQERPEQKLAQQKAQAYLDGIAARLRDERLLVDTQVVAGPAALAILNVARDKKADLVALATHGRGGIKRLLLGSVADKVIRGTPVPVLVCRPVESASPAPPPGQHGTNQ